MRQANTSKRSGHTTRPGPQISTGKGMLPSGAVSTVTDAILELAAALEVQEVRIKAVLLEAAEAGDLDLVRKILNLWVKGPVSEVTAQLGEIRSVQIGDTGPVS